MTPEKILAELGAQITAAAELAAAYCEARGAPRPPDQITSTMRAMLATAASRSIQREFWDGPADGT